MRSSSSASHGQVIFFCTRARLQTSRFRSGDKFAMRSFVALAAVAAAARANAANPDMQCWLNGRYDGGSGACKCNPGWAPPDCRYLALLPAPPLNVSTQTYFHPSNAGGNGSSRYVDNSWGISVLPGDGDGLLHGFMTELEGNCSLSSYGTASRILHVTSSASASASAGALGPWTVQDVALAAFAHNPNIVRDGDGGWLLYHIGSALPDCSISCASGKPVTHGNCTGQSHGASVARAASPYGPWQRVPYILPDNETNPSAVVLANGTIVVTARRWTGDVKLYTAQQWDGPYTQLPLAPLTPVSSAAVRGGDASKQGEQAAQEEQEQRRDAAAVPHPAGSLLLGNTTFFDEDPFLWVDALGYAHMLTHRQPSGTSCSPTGPTPDDCRCAGGHMFAESVWGPWYVDTTVLFNCTLQVQASSGGGSQSLQLHARQRPTLHFSNGSCPVLFTGASSDPISQYYSSFTMVQQTQC